MKESTDTAIITVTYNCADFIDSFLAATQQQLEKESLRARLFVVDNASSDATVERVRNYVDQHQLHDKVILCPQSENLGFGRGCNAGVEAAKTHSHSPQFYWFLNPDTRVFEDTGVKLRQFFGVTPTADFVGSQLVNDKGEARPSAFRFPSVISEFCRTLRLGVVDRLLQRGQLAIPVSDKPHQADWLTGASFMVKASVFDQLGGFDPAFFLYFEEVDLFYRAKQQGFSCWFNPASKVYHYAGGSTGMSSSRKAVKRRPQYWFDSRRHFYCKNFGRSYFAMCDVAAMSGLSLWQLRAALQRKESNDPPGLLKDIASNSIFFGRSDSQRST